MYLRNLEIKDAPLMFEWMHDSSVVENLQTDFSKKTIEDCVDFIGASHCDNQNVHFTISDETDEYQGTVSLKNINNGSAEFAITIRASAMGRGISSEAMSQIIQYGFKEKGLNSIYWCVSPENKRAVRFYDKNGYHRVSPVALNIGGGVQHRTDSVVLLVPHYTRGREEQNLRIIRRIAKLNADTLFLQPSA